jgi:hypothetical protein
MYFMNNLLPHIDRKRDTVADAPSHSPVPRQQWPSKALLILVIFLAFASGALLLLNDLPGPGNPLAHAPISALPLLLIGLASLGFQLIIRPGWLDLGKALIVSAAFLLWGCDQLLPPGWLATTLGDVVIVLYVIDLGWMMLDRLRQPKQGRRSDPDDYDP